MFEVFVTMITEFIKVTHTSSNISFISNFIDQIYWKKTYL